jgi:hypothetical protein
MTQFIEEANDSQREHWHCMEQIQGERIESLKAGLVGGSSTGLAFLLTLLAHRAIAQSTLAQSVTGAIVLLPATLFTPTGVVSALVAGITGFLFGVTYRYIVRQDANPHLKSGAVLAFGLVRGLTQVDVSLTSGNAGWVVLLLAAESLLLVTIARLSLDWAMVQGWVKPFGMEESAGTAIKQNTRAAPTRSTAQDALRR